MLPRVEISPEATSASGEQGSVNSERRTAAVILLIALSAAIYLGNAGFPALLDDADASHAIVAREMLTAAGRWDELRGELRELFERDQPLEYLVILGRKSG